MTTASIRINGARLFAAAQFVNHHEKFEYYEPLSCVEVRRCPAGGSTLVGLNGHVCGIAHDPGAVLPEGVDSMMLMLSTRYPGVRDLLKHCKPTQKSQDNYLTLQILGAGEDLATVHCGRNDTAVYAHPTSLRLPGSAQYPNWRKFMAHGETDLPGRACAWPVSDFGVFAKALPHLQTMGQDGIRLYPTAQEGPTFLRFGVDWFIGCVMPIKLIEDDPQIPDNPKPEWLDLSDAAVDMADAPADTDAEAVA